MRLILYSKPGCHLCEGLQEKLVQVQAPPLNLAIDLEVRDITTREDWFQAYEYEIPVLMLEGATGMAALPRPSPRASVQQLARMLQTYGFGSAENRTQ